MDEKKMVSCSGCTTHDTKEKQSVPRIVHEADMARMERQLKRSWILSIVLIVLLAGTNAAWIYYENQFEDVVTTVTQDLDSGSGGDAIIND